MKVGRGSSQGYSRFFYVCFLCVYHVDRRCRIIHVETARESENELRGRDTLVSHQPACTIFN